jgi:NAD(P)-dependent dehydrogenase (short-subunit alcohol dehydrogenase family)
MSTAGSVVIVGGTRAIGHELARTYIERGDDVVLTGQTPESVGAAVAVLRRQGTSVRGASFDLSRPEDIGGALADIGPVRRLALVAIDRDQNTVAEYDLVKALRLVTLKLVGYTEVIHALVPRFGQDSSILIFGGLARDRPYPGSTTVTTVNGGVTGLVRTLVIELAPTRVNALHPAIVGDSPAWRDMPPERFEALVARTPTGRLVTMAQIVDASRFLLENEAINGINLVVDGGWTCM